MVWWAADTAAGRLVGWSVGRAVGQADAVPRWPVSPAGRVCSPHQSEPPAVPVLCRLHRPCRGPSAWVRPVRRLGARRCPSTVQSAELTAVRHPVFSEPPPVAALMDDASARCGDG